MKFDCGEEWVEKKKRLETWHRFFCLWPRKLGPHDCRWLEWVERKGTCSYGLGGGCWSWEYRAIDANKS